MKASFLSSLILFICTINALGQIKSFPEDCKPVEIDAEEARQVAVEMLPTCGFGSVYIAKRDFEELMDVKGCVGIRFYIAMERSDQRYADIIAVAINTYGKEIGDFLARKYHMAKPLDAFFPNDFEKMDRFKAKKYVENLVNGEQNLSPYVGYLGSSGIKELLKIDGAQGLRIYPAELIKDSKSYRTMALGAVRIDGKDVKDVYATYLRGNLPCPTDCGGNDEKYYLWNK